MNTRFPLLSALAIAAVGCGCASSKPYQTSFNVPTLAARGDSDVVIEGVQIGLAPITRDNQGRFPQIARPVTWREPDAGAPTVIGSEGRAQAAARTVGRSGVIELVPLPAFYVGIANNSGKPLSLSGTKIEVEDNARRPYSAILSPEAVRQRFFGDVTGSNPFIAGDRGLMDRLMQQIVALPLLNPGVVIPNGETWRGYLVLDVNARSAKEYYSLMKSIQAFTVRLREVPTGAGAADFVFAVDKAERPTTFTCPGEVGDPSPEKCAPVTTPGMALP